ncbi:pyrroline-5-carboxylate reductase (plasmid) [Rhizobium leguminosarum]
MKHVTLVGAGNMGFAMLRTWTALDEFKVSVVEPNPELLNRAVAAGATPLSTTRSGPGSHNEIDVLVIATKPQMVSEVIAHHAGRLSKEALIVSVAAGVRIASMSEPLSAATAIIRAMPNTPAAVGEGMIVCCPNKAANGSEHRETAKALLAASGRVAFVDDESLMDAVTAVSGSGPAYVFNFIESLHAAAVAAGLDRDLALLLAKQTVFGAAKLAIGSDETPGRLREQVTSPNGTTAAALAVLMREQGGLNQLISEAVLAAKDRSIELGQ